MDHVMLTNTGNVNVTKSRDCSDRTYYLDTSSNENPTNNTVSNVYLWSTVVDKKHNLLINKLKGWADPDIYSKS